MSLYFTFVKLNHPFLIFKKLNHHKRKIILKEKTTTLVHILKTRLKIQYKLNYHKTGPRLVLQILVFVIIVQLDQLVHVYIVQLIDLLLGWFFDFLWHINWSAHHRRNLSPKRQQCKTSTANERNYLMNNKCERSFFEN